MSSWPTSPQPVDWDAYRLSVASIQEQQAAQAEKESEPATRRRTPKSEATDG
jgi:hypothetical protein